MKIKTIRFRLDAAEHFDRDVNAALAEGWHLTKREVLDGRQLGPDTYQHRMLYAELVMLDPEPEPESDLMGAVRVIAQECTSHDSCRDCPLQDVCNNDTPYHWHLPEEEV